VKIPLTPDDKLSVTGDAYRFQRT